MARDPARTRRAVNRAGRPRRRAPEASRDAILDAALRCFAKRGYHETSVDDIAERARLSKGAIYWHFAGKRELFLAWFARRGWRVKVLDTFSLPALGASGLPVGLLAPHYSPDDALLSRLTTREAQVLERIVAGRLNKQIADDLGISIKTVEAHRANIMEKLNANTVADLLKIALGATTAPAKG